ncbi:MAG: hypothetical protein JO108_10440 [Acidobacteriaceae bacterium]|nr:hypothetical protein [Acidobacteriaceae bacterium]
MSWSLGKLAVLSLAFAGTLLADDAALWKEFGLVHTQKSGESDAITTYQFKDLTGAMGAWEWLRSPSARPCALATFCTVDGNRTVISEDNYVISFEGKPPTQADVDATLNSLPNKRDTSLPAILTFLPKQGLVPNSARYALGPATLAAFAPELSGTKPGFDQGAEAQVATYNVAANPPARGRLALFYYPTPEMARFHATQFKTAGEMHVRRSGPLVAVVFGGASDAVADTLLSRVQYEAKITWNESPPPSPIKPLYALLVNILYLSAMLSAICLAAGLIYAGMRLYRRKYGTLDAEEAMTTLHLHGE